MASDPWNGMPENPERDSKGHVLRVDGRIDVYRWDAKDQWFKDGKDRWVSPLDLVKDGDEYLGHIITPADLAARVEAERERAAKWCDDKEQTSRSYGSHADAYEIAARAIRALGPTPAFDAAIQAAREDGMEAAARMADQTADAFDTGSVARTPAVRDAFKALAAAIRAAKDQPT